MAGNYPDAPDNRLEVDFDGTVGAIITSGGSITALTNGQMRNLNDESDATTVPTPGANGFTAYVFPVLRDLTAAFFSHSAGNATVAVSTDTTNGFDGAWSTVLTAAARTLATMPNYRSGIETFSSAGVKGIRVLSSTTGIPRTFHVYGHAAANFDRLELWHPSLDQPLYQTPASLDYADIMRGTSADLQFRLKNISTTLAANSITVSVEALTDSTAPTMISGMTLNYDGGSFGATVMLIDALPPNTITSGIFILRNTVSATQAAGLWSQRVVASAASWS